MMKLYSKKLDYRKNDFSLNYLGLVRLYTCTMSGFWLVIKSRYWTDNGACYYGTTGSKYANYEDLLVAVKEDANKSGIPYRYIQVIVIMTVRCSTIKRSS